MRQLRSRCLSIIKRILLDIKYNIIDFILNDTHNLCSYKITVYTFDLFRLFK